MATTVKVRVDAIEPKPDGHVDVRLIKVAVDSRTNEETPIFGEHKSYHRFVIPPGVTTAQAKPVVDAYLTDREIGAMAQSEYDMIEAVRTQNVNQQKVDAYNSSRGQTDSEIATAERQREIDEIRKLKG